MATAQGYAPGRVNLIGEHIDYNGGTVLPAALSVSLTVELTPRKDNTAIIRAEGYNEAANRDLGDAAHDHWSDAALGAVIEANRLGLISGGADVAIQSTIAAGSGLSSSAALIVAILKAARDLSGSDISDVDIAVAARRVENDYIGVPCGIMDQMAVALATPCRAMALDTKSLDYRLVDLPKNASMVVIHSGCYRQLSEGRYAERKEECDAAKAFFETDNLCALEPAAVQSASDLAEAPRKRALHCATEHRRVLAAIDALEASDVARFGALMNESHLSMRDDFEMSLPAIDALVESAVDFGAYGARLTGGGFGGCIVACVTADKREAWLEQLLAQHTNAHFVDHITPDA